MSIERTQFLGYTIPQYGNLGRAQYGETRPYQGESIPKYQPKELSAQDYERALEYLNSGKVQGGSNPAKATPLKEASDSRGAAFIGFGVPEANGTGELIPNVSDREDSIEGCPWEAYMA